MTKKHTIDPNGITAESPIPDIAPRPKNATTGNLARKSGRLSASEVANAQKAFSRPPSNIIILSIVNGDY